MKKLLIPLVVIAALALAFGVWWQGRHRPGTGELVLHGNVDIRQIALAFDGTGRVTELRVEEGDSVKAGAVLGVLDTRTLALQAEQAQAQIDVQEQNLKRLRNGSRPQEIAQLLGQTVEQGAAFGALRLRRRNRGDRHRRVVRGLLARRRDPQHSDQHRHRHHNGRYEQRAGWAVGGLRVGHAANSMAELRWRSGR